MLTAALVVYFGIAVAVFCVFGVPAYYTFRDVWRRTPLRRVKFWALAVVTAFLWPVIIAGVISFAVFDYLVFVWEEVRGC